MLVLLSIRPAHVANIISGLKVFEFRRRIFVRPDVRTVVIYCTMPVGKLVGEFDIVEILRDKPDRLWRRTRRGSGISKSHFDRYFRGANVAFALRIGEVRPFAEQIRPATLIKNFTPPQSYMYVSGLTSATELSPS
jgi:predicted transcriptional regulator